MITEDVVTVEIPRVTAHGCQSQSVKTATRLQRIDMVRMYITASSGRAVLRLVSISINVKKIQEKKKERKIKGLNDSGPLF